MKSVGGDEFSKLSFERTLFVLVKCVLVLFFLLSSHCTFVNDILVKSGPLFTFTMCFCFAFPADAKTRGLKSETFTFGVALMPDVCFILPLPLHSMSTSLLETKHQPALTESTL